MILKTRKKSNFHRGFTALISTVLLATGVLAFTVTTLASSVMYSDMVYRREIRMQVRLNLSACLDTVRLMIARDYFISGTSTLSEFGCTAYIENDFSGNYSADVVSELSGIKSMGHI